ncbi:hypothetical protein QFC21_005353 [Naganishia friedmannii]|uniref:Uncharacterized protein n=1 Tax=Naganishia friedmannii TaxID=89922 RepID=A0ACC2VA65_9TREE|nr:hypothetical protein QFC21_005353 [Naganishia friedmannii]
MAPILTNINLQVDENDVLILKGRSGSGKTTLLKCLAALNVYQEGEIRLHGKQADLVMLNPPNLLPFSLPGKQVNTVRTCREDSQALSPRVPTYRTKVLYVPQRPSLLPGTPKDFLETIISYSSRTTKSGSHKGGNKTNAPPGASSSSSSNNNREQPPWARALQITKSWGMDPALWQREWATLSGGEGQRMSLAVAVSLGQAEVILLDEPTSALDSETIKLVEKTLLSLLPNGDNPDGTLKAYVWITHEAAQADRVGTRTFDVSKE